MSSLLALFKRGFLVISMLLVAQVQATEEPSSNSPPVASFSCTKMGIQIISCESTSTDDQGITQILWTLDDGTTYSTVSFEHTFNRPQDVAIDSHLVKLKVFDSENLSDELEQTIAVDLDILREAPRGYFKVSLNGNKATLSSFIVKTQFPIKEASYNIYDANSNFIKKVDITDFYANTKTVVEFESNGEYRARLYVKDWRNQEFTTNRTFPIGVDTVYLFPYVDARIVQSAPKTIYANLSSSFTFDEYLSIRSFFVNFGDGQTQEFINNSFFTHEYTNPGNYTVTITAHTNHGTSSTITRQVNVTNNQVNAIRPDPTFSYLVYPYAQNVGFMNEKSGTPNGQIISYIWDFGDGTTGYGETQSHFYAPGTYIASLTVVDSMGLSSTQTQKIVITNQGNDLVARVDCNYAMPFVDITQKCKVTALDRLNDISQVRVIWGNNTANNLGAAFDPNQGIWWPTKKYNAPGTYPVRLVVSTNRGASRAHEVNLSLTERLPGSFIQCFMNHMSISCNGLSSYDPKGNGLTYSFDFGDGYVETNNVGFVTYAYSSPGLYNVKLKVTDSAGDFAFSEMSVQALLPVNNPPYLAFNCISNSPYALICNAEGTHDSDGTIQTIKYHFDDGTIIYRSDLSNYVHVFETSGEHSVSVTAIDNDGGQATITKSFIIRNNQPPVAMLNCEVIQQKITCNSLSYDNDSLISTFIWTLDDEIYMGSSFSHYFKTVGLREVQLKVIDEFGAESVVSNHFNITENKLPSFDLIAEAPPGTLPLVAKVQALDAIDPDGEIVSYQWYLGSEIVSTDEELFYTFNTAGTYHVKLKVFDNGGGSTEKEITLIASRYADIVIDTNVSQGLPLLDVTFDASDTTTLDGTISKMEWFYQGDKIADGNILQYSFDQAGDHLVELKVTNSFGLETYASKKITVLQPPVYLEGDAYAYTFVGVPYEVSYNLLLAEDLEESNIYYTLMDAPIGVSFDEIEKKLRWTPTLNQVGIHNFKISVSDGVLYSERRVKIEVYNPRVIGQSTIGSNGGELLLNTTSIVHGAKVTFPKENESYSVQVYESGPSDNPLISFNTSKELEKPIRLIFNRTMDVGMHVAEGMHQTIASNSRNVYKSQFKIVSDEEHLFCARTVKVNERLNSERYREIKRGNIKIRFDHSIQAEMYTKLLGIINGGQTLEKLPVIENIPFKIYFKSLVGSNVLGRHSSTVPDVLEIDPFKRENGHEAILKHTLFHEAFHALQANVFGCRWSQDSLSYDLSKTYRGLTESSADIYAFGLLDDLTKKPVKDLHLGSVVNLTEREAAITMRYNRNISSVDLWGNQIRSNFAKGVLRASSSNGNLLPYYNHLILDNEVNMLEVLEYYKNSGNVYLNSVTFTRENFGEMLLKGYLISKGRDVNQVLLKVLENISSKHPSDPMTKSNSSLIGNLRDNTFLNWENVPSSDIDEVKNINDNSLGLTLEKLTLPPMSGTTLRYRVEDLKSKINRKWTGGGVPSFIEDSRWKAEYIDVLKPHNSNIGIGIRANSTTNGQVHQRYFFEAQDRYRSVQIYSEEIGHQYYIDEYVEFHFVNSSLESQEIIPKIELHCDKTCYPNTWFYFDRDYLSYSAIGGNFSVVFRDTSDVDVALDFGDGNVITFNTSNSIGSIYTEIIEFLPKHYGFTHFYDESGIYDVTLTIKPKEGFYKGEIFVDKRRTEQISVVGRDQ